MKRLLASVLHDSWHGHAGGVEYYGCHKGARARFVFVRAGSSGSDLRSARDADRRLDAGRGPCSSFDFFISSISSAGHASPSASLLLLVARHSLPSPQCSLPATFMTSQDAHSRPRSSADAKSERMSTTDEKRTSVATTLPPHPPRSLAKDVVLICTVTLAMILNVSRVCPFLYAFAADPRRRRITPQSPSLFRPSAES